MICKGNSFHHNEYILITSPAAKQLGEWWSSDEATFVEVTLGTGRIYAIMRAMSDMFEPRVPITSKTAVFCTVPGETHSLGVKMATDMFRKNGWQIDLNIGMSHAELVESIGSAQHMLIGLSGGGVHSVSD
jgi:methanogenic corrinoid protein MtbC1